MAGMCVGSRLVAGGALVMGLFCGAARADGPSLATATATAAADDLSALPAALRTVRMSGRLPWLDPAEPFDDEVTIEFAIYASPTGGEPAWREKRRVKIAKSRIDVRLGEEVPLPDSVFTQTFRYVGLRFDGEEELTPRFPIECCLWALAPGAMPASKGESGAAPSKLVPIGGGVAVEAAPRAPATWLEAVLAAQKAQRRLPSAEEWLAAHRAGEKAGFVGMSGHYEWVQPFVFSAQSYGAEVSAYQGKLNGCMEEELSPSMNRFVWRMAADDRP